MKLERVSTVEHGFGVLGVPGLLIDWRTGQPLFVRTRRTARRYRDGIGFGWPEVVRLTRMPPVANDNGLPTYIVERLR